VWLHFPRFSPFSLVHASRKLTGLAHTPALAFCADRQRSVKVLLSSGFNEVEAVRRFTGKGLAGFLQKPYPAAVLAETIKRILSNET
jgi:FixJ family two-component response regulator